jgi:hypothetical protein
MIIEQIKIQIYMNWIKTQDRLPEKEGDYIVVWLGDVEVLWYDTYLGWLNISIQDQDEVTHWQPLPDKPKR